MNKEELLIYTKNNEVIKVCQSEDEYIKKALEELIEEYSSNDISDFNSIEEILLEIKSLDINTTIFTINIFE